ncbi:MauE/DoxX family redox-associated membrane protein [Flavobacterium sp. B183]|uniref:MauE/DoxX family redox-associated membrane protein n=1 Tax=Flavobacterium sp. B183 TaxID=907046 RepID=UPI0035317EF0
MFYAAISKMVELDIFFKQLAKSPLMPFNMEEKAGTAVLIVEFLVVYFVYKKEFKKTLILSFVLMMFFSLYIGYLMYFSYYIPCSCGGILGNMSWNVHLIFNSVLTVIVAIAYLVSQ